MKRFLALLLTLVMLVSVCGLQAFAVDGDTSGGHRRRAGRLHALRRNADISCRRYFFVYLLVPADVRLRQQDYGPRAV